MAGPLASRAGPPKAWPPPERHRAGEYSVQGPSERSQSRDRPVEPEVPETVSPAEISAVTAIANELGHRLDVRIDRIERAIAGGPAAELSAALTLSTRSVKRWKAIAGAVLAVAGALGWVGGKEAGAPPTSEARLDALENRMARIERKLDAALPQDRD